MEPREPVEPEPPESRVREERQVTNPGTTGPGDSAEVVSTFNPGWRAVQLAYLVFGVIDGLLLIRLVLKLLGANPRAGFSNWIYSVTDIFLGPFKNLLPTVGNEQSLLELSTVVAILVYALIGWAVARLFAIIFYRNVTVRRRSDLRPRGY
ncbi:MAG: YggT family protein [Chloroflexi bacterium]|nr:MAG: YggT family protein [Chloroflexota bacterium]